MLVLGSNEPLSLPQKRLVYGLTVRLQEKRSWKALRRKVCKLLSQLDKGEDDEEEDTTDEKNSMKKQRMDMS